MSLEKVGGEDVLRVIKDSTVQKVAERRHQKWQWIFEAHRNKVLKYPPLAGEGLQL